MPQTHHHIDLMVSHSTQHAHVTTCTNGWCRLRLQYLQWRYTLTCQCTTYIVATTESRQSTYIQPSPPCQHYHTPPPQIRLSRTLNPLWQRSGGVRLLDSGCVHSAHGGRDRKLILRHQCCIHLHLGVVATGDTVATLKALCPLCLGCTCVLGSMYWNVPGALYTP